jgi:hypothetical protein
MLWLAVPIDVLFISNQIYPRSEVPIILWNGTVLHNYLRYNTPYPCCRLHQTKTRVYCRHSTCARVNQTTDRARRDVFYTAGYIRNTVWYSIYGVHVQYGVLGSTSTSERLGRVRMCSIHQSEYYRVLYQYSVVYTNKCKKAPSGWKPCPLQLFYLNKLCQARLLVHLNLFFHRLSATPVTSSWTSAFSRSHKSRSHAVRD